MANGQAKKADVVSCASFLLRPWSRSLDFTSGCRKPLFMHWTSSHYDYLQVRVEHPSRAAFLAYCCSFVASGPGKDTPLYCRKVSSELVMRIHLSLRHRTQSRSSLHRFHSCHQPNGQIQNFALRVLENIICRIIVNQPHLKRRDDVIF